MIADVSCVVCLEYYIVRQLFLCVTELGHLTELGHHTVPPGVEKLSQLPRNQGAADRFWTLVLIWRWWWRHVPFLPEYLNTLRPRPKWRSSCRWHFQMHSFEENVWIAIKISPNYHVTKVQINSLRPSDTMWRHRSGSTLAQVMTCCLTAPSNYLNQCWLVIRKV